MSFADLEAERAVAPFRKRDGNLIVKSNSTQSVASCLFQINTAVSKFKRLVDDIGSQKDTPDLRHKINATRQHISQLVKDTSAKLKQSSELDQNAGVSEIKRINDVKLVKDFQTILNEYQKVQRLAVEKEATSSLSSDMDVSSDKTSDGHSLLGQSKRQEILVLDNEVAFNAAIAEERDQGIQEIQQQIGDVNEIFKDLAVLVDKQGLVIEDISTHIDNSHAVSAESKSLLKKASATQSSASSLSCLLLVIFAVILVMKASLESKGEVEFKVCTLGKNVTIKKNMVAISVEKKKEHHREFTPSVIEPSFGIGRIIYCLFEHSFYTRPRSADSEQLNVFRFPPLVAPYKCTVFPLVKSLEFDAVAKIIAKLLTEAGISHIIDITGTSIGKRYARTDEIGVPFAITVDDKASVTIRERDTRKQIRVSIEQVAAVVKEVVNGQSTWEDIMWKYPSHAAAASADAE